MWLHQCQLHWCMKNPHIIRLGLQLTIAFIMDLSADCLKNVIKAWKMLIIVSQTPKWHLVVALLPINSPKCKDSSFTVMNNKESWQILTSEKQMSNIFLLNWLKWLINYDVKIEGSKFSFSLSHKRLHLYPTAELSWAK